MKMSVLLSFICCNDDFLINEFKCAWDFDEGFWQIEWWCFSDVSGFVQNVSYPIVGMILL